MVVVEVQTALHCALTKGCSAKKFDALSPGSRLTSNIRHCSFPRGGVGDSFHGQRGGAAAHERCRLVGPRASPLDQEPGSSPSSLPLPSTFTVSTALLLLFSACFPLASRSGSQYGRHGEGILHNTKADMADTSSSQLAQRPKLEHGAYVLRKLASDLPLSADGDADVRITCVEVWSM